MTDIQQHQIPDQWWRQRDLLHNYDWCLFSQLERYIGHRVLEVGCGIGTMTRFLLERDLVVAIDLSERNAARTRNRIAQHPNCDVLVMDLTEPEFLNLRSRRFDTVICSNVLEHIADERLALRNIHAVLQERGRLVLVVPAHRWLYGSLDKSIGHLRRYEDKHLRELLFETGFTIQYRTKTNLWGAFGWFFVGRLLRQSTIPSMGLRLFDRFAPWAMALEGILKPPFGLSLVYVGERLSGGKRE